VVSIIKNYKIILSVIVLMILLFASIGQANKNSISDYIRILVDDDLIDYQENNSYFEETPDDGTIFDLNDLFSKGSFGGYSFLYTVISFLVYFIKKIFPNNPILKIIGL